MNGCQYTQKRFTIPTSEKTQQVQWDFCFLSRAEFEEKYGQDKYTEMTKL